MKCRSDRVYTNFQNNKIPKNVEYFTCLSVISQTLFLLIQTKNTIYKYFQKNVNTK